MQFRFSQVPRLVKFLEVSFGALSKEEKGHIVSRSSFGALSKEEKAHIQVSRCTDTGNCTWTEYGTKPQLLLGGLGEEGGGGSSLQQMIEEEFGELSFLLGEPQVRTVIIQYSTNVII